MSATTWSWCTAGTLAQWLGEVDSGRRALFAQVHDELLEPTTLSTLRLAASLRHRLPDVSLLAAASPAAVAALASALLAPATAGPGEAEPAISLPAHPEYSPRLSFVFNRMGTPAFQPEARARLGSVLRHLFTPDAEATDGGAAADGTGSGALPAAPPAAPPYVGLLPDRSCGSHGCASHTGCRRRALSRRVEQARCQTTA